MPRMSGRDAFQHMIEINPLARIMFSTGYSADDLMEVDSSMGLLSKPYRPQELVAAVRHAARMRVLLLWVESRTEIWEQNKSPSRIVATMRLRSFLSYLAAVSPQSSVS